MHTRSMRNAVIAAATFLALPATAHVTANPNEAPAGQFFTTSFRIPHGCDGSPTVAVRIKVPDGVVAVKPQMKPGWAITITKRTLDKPVEMGHGVTVRETVDEVAWRGGPLPDAYYDDFGLSVRIVAAGGALWFPVVQECEQGVHRWIEIPAAGQGWGDLKQPAPFVKVMARAVDSIEVRVNSISADGIGGEVGTLRFTAAGDGISIMPNLRGFAPGPHAFHVHEKPDCGPAVQNGKHVAGLAAGGHYNGAGGHGHGHMAMRGDLPELTAAADGAVTMPIAKTGLTLAELRGRSVMIHEYGEHPADPKKPKGGGARIACAVIP